MSKKEIITVSTIINASVEKVWKYWTEVIENFEAENTFSIDTQKAGWQSILDQFKEYVANN